MKKILLTLFLGLSLSGFSQTTLLPDPNFEQALIDLGYDSPPINGSVPTANISGVETLEVSDKSITDLTGIEDFNSLIELYCYDNPLTSLDVTNNTALRNLYCYNNQLTSLDVRNGYNTFVSYFVSHGNPDLTCIFVDDPAYSSANWPYIDPNSTFVANEEECSLVSVAVNTFELGISVYPNPTNNYLFIEGNKNSISFSIYNLLGKKVMSVKNSNRVDVRDLSNGVYTIRISDGVSQTDRKFIKN